jgi:hypothetical protein
VIDPFDVLRDELVQAATRVQTTARRRPVWWSRRRSRPIAIVIAALVVGGSATAAVVSLKAESSAPLAGAVPGHVTTRGAGLFRVEPGEAYSVTVAPVLQAGLAGLCTMLTYRSTRGGFGSGGCGGSYPTSSQPLFGDIGIAFYTGGRIRVGGAIQYVLTGPGVAAVRVGTSLTVSARKQSGLPAGDGAVVFYLPAGSPTIKPPGIPPRAAARTEGLTLTALAADGQPIPTTPANPPFRLPERFWQQPQPQPKGRCTLAAPPTYVPVRGTVVYSIRAVPGVEGAALLSCLSTDYIVDNTTIVAAVLLNARSPGTPPPAIFGTQPVAGAPGFVHREYPIRALPPITARRSGNAWIVVQGGHSLAQRISILRRLKITAINRKPSP